MERRIKPMLCKEEEAAFDSPDYIWETKYDGARIIAHVNSDGFRLFSRSGSEKTRLFPDLRIETKVPCILDGEVVSGSSFNDIQHRINRGSGIDLAAKSYPAVFKVFDVLQVEMNSTEFNLAMTPLFKRKDALEEILLPNETTLLAEYTEKGVDLFNQIVANLKAGLGGEGVIGKRKQGLYLQDKREWLKVKTWCYNYDYYYGPESTGETILAVGYTQGTGWRKDTFGALVLARLEKDGAITHIGEVGTGFDASDIRSLFAMFSPLSTCPFPRAPATWIKPFAIKLRYLEYTNDGKLRFPSFKGVV